MANEPREELQRCITCAGCRAPLIEYPDTEGKWEIEIVTCKEPHDCTDFAFDTRHPAIAIWCPACYRMEFVDA